MRTVHWIALIGSIAALAIACSSEDDTQQITPGKGGSGGGVVGKGGAAGKAGAAGTTNEGGSSNEGGAAGSAAGSAGAAGGGACDPETQSKSTTCQNCQKSACAAEGSACKGNEECLAIFTAAESCQDNACIIKAFADHPNGQKDAIGYLGCSEATCHDDCYCAGTCTLGTNDDTCNTCFHGACGTDCAGCDKNSACMSLMMCFSYLGCKDDACMQNCATLFQDGVAPYNAVGTCMETNCKTECGTGG